MKRELNSRSRRKWVVGGAMVFGSIALLSTGFATWVIGTNIQSQDQKIEPGVDVIKNGGFILAAELGDDKEIQIGDNGPITGFVSVADEETNLDLEFDIDLSVERMDEDVAPGALTVAVKGDTGKVTTADLADKGFNAGRTAASYSVLEYSSHTAVDWTKDTSKSSDGVYVYTGTSTVTLSLKYDIWGGKTSIAAFYNGFYVPDHQPDSDDPWTIETIKTAKTAIEDDINQIVDLLDGFTVTVTAALKAA